MTLPIKIIATDFDGTLYADTENPPVPLHLQALISRLQSEGAKWIINTGRDLPGLLEILDRARLSVQPDYLVVVEREIHCRHQFSYVDYAPWNRRCHEVHTSLFARIKPDLPRLRSWVREHFNALVYEDNYSPFCLQAENNADTDLIMSYLDQYCAQIPGLSVVRNDVYARLGHTDFTKGTALAEISRQLGVPQREVFAAGDHFNDLPMLTEQFAGCLAAPSNAIAAVKAAVLRQQGYVSQHPYGHGVARALEYYLRGRNAAVDPKDS